jgi:hypothetical protein
MEVTETTARAWRRSSRSAGANNCVEIAAELDAVRDSKQPGAVLARVEVPALVAAVRHGWLAR